MRCLKVIAPVLLGDGVRPFDRPGGTGVRLARIHPGETPGAANLWMRAVR